MGTILYYSILFTVLVIGVFIWFKYKRNYFNKYKYVRVERYTDSKSIEVTYYKKKEFNKDNQIKINPDHIFDFKGYKTIIVTSNSAETINPLNFKSQYDAKEFRTAITSHVVSDLFTTLKTDKLDTIKLLLLLNIIQLIAIVYLIYTLGTK